MPPSLLHIPALNCTAAKHAELPLTPPAGPFGRGDRSAVLVDARAEAIADSRADRRRLRLGCILTTPGILDRLTSRGSFDRRPIAACQQFRCPAYADIARMLPWQESSENVDAWLAVRTVELIASKLPGALSVGNLQSPEGRMRGVCTGRCPPGQAGPDGVE